MNFYLYLAAALLTVRRLIQRACTLDRLGHPPHGPTPEVIPIAGRSRRLVFFVKSYKERY